MAYLTLLPDYLTLVPAYGRDYSSAKAVREAWASGADFHVVAMGPHDGRVFNREDAPGRRVLNIRYKRLTRVCVVRT